LYSGGRSQHPWVVVLSPFHYESGKAERKPILERIRDIFGCLFLCYMGFHQGYCPLPIGISSPPLMGRIQREGFATEET